MTIDLSISKNKSFGDYYWGVIARPRRGFEALLADNRRLKFGILALSITAVLYTLFYMFATIGGGAPSTFKPWLAIPIEEYYRYNQFLLAPSMFMCWILAAGVVQLLSRLFSGKGSFEDTLSVLGFGISIASWSTLIHDLTDGFLGAVGIINLKEYEAILNGPTFWRSLLWFLFTLYLIFFILFFSKGIGAAHKLRPGPAAFLGVVAFLVYQFVFVIFNR
jgi:hypothetical protein